jgi:hypothetical protein
MPSWDTSDGFLDGGDVLFTGWFKEDWLSIFNIMQN